WALALSIGISQNAPTSSRRSFVIKSMLVLVPPMISQPSMDRERRWLDGCSGTQPLSEPNAGWLRPCIRETQLSTPCLRTLISDSNPHSGGFLSRRQPLAKSAPMWRLRVFWVLWRVCACRLIIRDQSTPAAWSPCSLTGCAMARSQRRAEFLSVPSTHVLRLAGCLDAPIAKEAQVKFPQRKPLHDKRLDAVWCLR